MHQLKQPRPRYLPHLEVLETRLAPAKLVNASTVRFQDVDGDTVTVALSQAVLNDGNVNTVFQFDTGTVDGTTNTKQQLQKIDLTVLGANGLSVIVTAAKSLVNGGNNRVNVGHVDATGFTVGKIVIAGDLGQADAGDGSSRAAAKLKVHSLGALGLLTQGGAGSLISVFNGGIGKLIVKKDVVGANFQAPNGDIGKVSIGGSLIGREDGNTGLINTGGNIGPVFIGGDIIGGDGSNAGSVQANGFIESVVVGGSLRGGSGNNSAKIEGGFLGVVKIGGDLIGSDGPVSAVVQSDAGDFIKIKVGGSVIGGSNGTTGFIGSAGNLGVVKILGNLVGGSNGATGVIQVAGQVAKAVIGGSVLAGTVTDTAFIKAGNDIVSLTINGNVLGTAAVPVLIQARGQAAPGGGVDLAIGNLTIGGRVENAVIRAGFDLGDAPVNADAQIGTVKVFGDWVASSLAAGVDPIDAFFGNDDDVLINEIGQDPTITASIARVIIKGSVLGTISDTDAFGFVAQEIGSVKIDGSFVALSPGAGNDNIVVGLGDDVKVREV